MTNRQISPARIEYCDTPPPAAATERIIADALNLAPATTDVQFIITGDFNRSVRERISSSTYDSLHRVNGETAAKTIPSVNGAIHVLVNTGPLNFSSRQFVWGGTRGSASRLLAHEMMHAVMYARGEDSPNIDTLAASRHDTDLLSRGARMVSEYRAERALCTTGLLQDMDYTGAATAELEELTIPRVQRALLGLGSLSDPERASKLRSLLEALPYTAAMPKTVTQAHPIWRTGAGPTAVGVMEALRGVPDARYELDARTEADQIRQVAQSLPGLAARLGF